MLSRFLERGDSEEELERRPLLRTGRVPSSTSLLSSSSSSSSVSSLFPRGKSRENGGGGGGRRGEADEDDPEQQRSAILKLKRINAHLANERTLLAWVRAVGKMFSAGVLCLSLAGDGYSPTYTVCFVGMGMVYFAMGPYVVFVGAKRFHQAAQVMKGSVHDTYSFFSGSHLRGLTYLMMALAVVTVALMATQLSADLY
ncbi:unnamed protein product [Ectocarpus sp. 12 AP-2014]